MQQQRHYQSLLIMATPLKNVNKDGLCLGSRPIDTKQRIKIFKHRDETEVSKNIAKIPTRYHFPWKCCVYLKCMPGKGKKSYITNTPKSENAVSS